MGCLKFNIPFYLQFLDKTVAYANEIWEYGKTSSSKVYLYSWSQKKVPRPGESH